MELFRRKEGPIGRVSALSLASFDFTFSKLITSHRTLCYLLEAMALPYSLCMEAFEGALEPLDSSRRNRIRTARNPTGGAHDCATFCLRPSHHRVNLLPWPFRVPCVPLNRLLQLANISCSPVCPPSIAICEVRCSVITTHEPHEGSAHIYDKPKPSSSRAFPSLLVANIHSLT